MQSFIIAGKAKTVFRLIELKTQRAREAELEQKRLLGLQCPFDDKARCDVQKDMTCAEARCRVWNELQKEGENERT